MNVVSAPSRPVTVAVPRSFIVADPSSVARCPFCSTIEDTCARGLHFEFDWMKEAEDADGVRSSAVALAAVKNRAPRDFARLARCPGTPWTRTRIAMRGASAGSSTMVNPSPLCLRFATHGAVPVLASAPRPMALAVPDSAACFMPARISATRGSAARDVSSQ